MKAPDLRALVESIGFTHIKGSAGWLSIAAWRDDVSPGFRLVMARVSPRGTH